MVAVTSNPSVEVPENNCDIMGRFGGNCRAKVIIEFVLVFRGGILCRCIGYDDGDHWISLKIDFDDSVTNLVCRTIRGCMFFPHK